MGCSIVVFYHLSQSILRRAIHDLSPRPTPASTGRPASPSARWSVTALVSGKQN